MTVLDDHRQLAAATVAVTASAAVTIALILALSGHVSSAPGILVGAALGVADVLLLRRALTRYARRRRDDAPGPLTSMLISRFAVIGSLLGLLMAARGLQPLSVVAGFLLFPVSLGGVAVIGARQVATEATHAAR